MQSIWRVRGTQPALLVSPMILPSSLTQAPFSAYVEHDTVHHSPGVSSYSGQSLSISSSNFPLIRLLVVDCQHGSWQVPGT